MTLIHIMQGVNLFTFIILVFQIRMLNKSRKNMISVSEKLLSDLRHVGNMMKKLNETRGEDERR